MSVNDPFGLLPYTPKIANGRSIAKKSRTLVLRALTADGGVMQFDKVQVGSMGHDLGPSFALRASGSSYTPANDSNRRQGSCLSKKSLCDLAQNLQSLR